jgi:hypothetical protein
VAFPAGLAIIEVTGLNLLAFDGTPLSGAVIFTASGPVEDPAVNLLLEGSATGQVSGGVMTPVTIPTTDCVSPGFTYTITAQLQTPDGAEGGPPPVSGILIPHTLGATVDLSALLSVG